MEESKNKWCMWISSAIKNGEYAGVIEYYGLEKHDCKQIVRTKCSLFDQWTQLISELAGGKAHFNKGRQTDKKFLILPSAAHPRRENRWATPKNTGTIVSCYPPEEES